MVGSPSTRWPFDSAFPACYARAVSGCSNRSSWDIIVLVLLIGILVVRVAAAEEEPSKEESLFKEGLRFFDDANFESALEKFEELYELDPRAKVLLNIGTALLNLERHAEAANTYQRYIDSPGVEKKRAKEIRKILRRLDRELGVLIIQVDSQDPVEVLVDDELVGTCPPKLKVRVDPGSHLIAVDGASIEDIKEVGLLQGTQLEVSFDKTSRNETNKNEVANESANDGDQALEPDEQSEPSGLLPDRGRTTKETLGLTLGASGLLALGVGSGFAIDAQRKFNRVGERCVEECVFPANLESKARGRERLAIVLVGAGAVALAAGVALYLWGRSEHRKAAVALIPIRSGAVGAVGAIAWTF